MLSALPLVLIYSTEQKYGSPGILSVMKAYSVDLRERVLDALANGMSRAEVCRLFQVSEGSLKRWLRLQRAGQSLEARLPPGRPARITPAQQESVQRLVEALPDATLAEYSSEWNQLHDRPISQWTIGRAIRRAGITRKKRVSKH